jgi:hypothetical protein
MEDEQEQQEEQQGQEQQVQEQCSPLRKRKGNLRDIAPVNYARKSNK